MSITRHEIEAFHRFTIRQLDEPAPSSLVELVRLWEAERRDYEETVEDVRAGLADYEAGLGKPLKESFQEIREELGLSE